jgi:hypothetical protein
MAAPFLASITVLSGAGAQPKGGGGATTLAMIFPLSGDHADHGPVDPGWGGGLPAGPDSGWGGGIPAGGIPHPGGGPINPDHPENSLPPGGTPVPPEISNGLPPPAGDLGNQVVVAIYVPGKGWTGKSFPAPQPK